jgi:preprotein translocase subunit SecF
MIELFRDARYDFIGRRRWAYTASITMTLVGLISLFTWGLRFDVDFTGGTLVQVRFERPPAIASIRAALTSIGLGDAVIQQFGDVHEYILRTSQIAIDSAAMTKRIEAALASDRSLGPLEIRRAEYVGPQVGRDLQLQGVYAVGAGLIGILGYIAVRFDLKGGVAAVVAVVHDVLVCLGAISLTGREFSLAVLAALLTIIGYSVNDTIVAYDRLRENRQKPSQRGRSFADQMNDAINQTLSRTILTSLTTFFSAAILLFLGGKTLEDFAFVLFVGILTGTYSTTYVAAALVVDWTLWFEATSPTAKGSKARSG